MDSQVFSTHANGVQLAAGCGFSCLEVSVKKLFAALSLCVSAIVVPAIAQAAPIALQTFDDPHGWFFGGGPGGFPATSFPVQLGGPGGATDPYLSLTSTGLAGPQSRLTAINTTEFTGDYTAAGVSAISMDLRNFGTNDLFIRLLLLDFDAITGVPINGALTTAPVFLPSGSGWQNAAFDVTAAGLTLLFPGGTAADLLANVDELRIFHNQLPEFGPNGIPAIAAVLGVDNISTGAVAAPEPATLTLLLGGLAAAVARRRRRSSR